VSTQLRGHDDRLSESLQQDPVPMPPHTTTDECPPTRLQVNVGLRFLL
jgi:hypothetical protein